MQIKSGRILIVDDEENIRLGLRAVLAQDGHHITQAADVHEALELLQTAAFEVAILDIRMPGMSGLTLLHKIHECWPQMATIILTGHGSLQSAITAVKEGAHDYLLKPVQPQAIRQVINNALQQVRRTQEEQQLLTALRSGLHRLDSLSGDAEDAKRANKGRYIIIGSLQIDTQTREVKQNSSSVALTPSEYQLLVTLGNHLDEVLDYQTLVSHALHYDAAPWEAKELIKRHIFSLRHKIEPTPSEPQFILNVRGVGYRLTNPQTKS